MFLVWPLFADEGAREIADTLAQHARRIVYLSAEAAGTRPGSFWTRLERAVERSATGWTFLRPTGSPPR